MTPAAKGPFLWINVGRRPSQGNKALFSSSSTVMWMGPKIMIGWSRCAEHLYWPDLALTGSMEVLFSGMTDGPLIGPKQLGNMTAFSLSGNSMSCSLQSNSPCSHTTTVSTGRPHFDQNVAYAQSMTLPL